MYYYIKNLLRIEMGCAPSYSGPELKICSLNYSGICLSPF